MWVVNRLQCLLYDDHDFEEAYHFDKIYLDRDGLDIRTDEGTAIVERCKWCGKKNEYRDDDHI